MKELVSVIIPFYNEEQYIGDCLISLIKQTYKNIEIICVDDGSTDNGAMIVKAIQQSDSRISLIQQENMNAGTARNVGFSKAKGEYVLFLDSDDFFSPSMVERMLNKALSTNSDIVFCTGYGLNVITKETYMMPPVGKDNASFPNKEVFSSADTTDGIFQLSVTWAWDKMYRTDFIRKNDIFFQGTKVCNDLVFVCLSYLFSERITSVNQHFICHRTNIASSLYSAGERNWKCLFEALSELENRLICEDLYNKHRISFLNLVVENIVYYLLMRFTDGNCFSSFYTYYKNNVSDHYNFMQYPKEIYRDDFAYNIIKSLENDSKDSFLLNCIHLLNAKQSEALRVSNSKKWCLPYDLIVNKKKIIICGENDASISFFQQITNSNLNSVCSILSLRDIFDVENENSISFDIFCEIDLIIITYEDFNVFHRCSNYFLSLGIDKSKVVWINALYSDEWIADYILRKDNDDSIINYFK